MISREVCTESSAIIVNINIYPIKMTGMKPKKIDMTALTMMAPPVGLDAEVAEVGAPPGDGAPPEEDDPPEQPVANSGL